MWIALGGWFGACGAVSGLDKHLDCVRVRDSGGIVSRVCDIDSLIPVSSPIDEAPALLVGIVMVERLLE